MKLIKTTFAAAAFATAALTGNSAHAQAAVTGDVILGFDVAGGSYTYEVDLGAASQFVGQAAGSTQTFSLDPSDLTNFVSSTWSTSTKVQFGLVGGTNVSSLGNLTLGSQTFAPDTLFVTANAWAPTPTNSSSQGQSAALAKYNQLEAGYNNGNSGAGNSDTGEAYATGTKDTVGFDVLSASSVNFSLPSGAGYNHSVVDYNTDGTVPSPISTSLNLYELAPNDALVGSNTVTLLGSVALSNTGGNPELTFTAVTAPEPATYLLMGLGGIALIWRQNRKSALV